MLRDLIIGLLILHGLVHLIGFVKAFELATVQQLNQPISKPAGALWFTVFITFLVSSILFLIHHRLWWMPTALGIALSQVLIITSWQDAKYGTLANMFILIALIASFWMDFIS